MLRKIFWLGLVFGFVVCCKPNNDMRLSAQEPANNINWDNWADRMSRSKAYNQTTANKLFRDSVKLNFFGADEAYAWYRVGTGPNRFEYVIVNTQNQRRELAFDHDMVARRLNELTQQEVEATNLAINRLRFSDDARQVDFLFSGKRYRIDRSNHTLLPIEAANAESGEPFITGLQPLATLERSSSGGDATSIDIENRTAKTLTVYWRDPSGQNQIYGRLDPGQHFSSSTYVGHVWLLVDEDDRWIAAFNANSLDTQAIVDEQTIAPKPADRGAQRGGRNRGNRELGGGNVERLSPDGRWAVFFRDHNVVLRQRDTDEEFTLTTDGTESNEFNGRVWWSPDSQHFVAMKTERATQRMITLVESSPSDQLQPKLMTIPYTKPGDQLDHPRPYLFHVSGESPTGNKVDDSLFSNPFSINNLRWRTDSTAFSFVYNERGHQTLRVVSVDAASGEPRALIDETSETFVCYSHKFYYEVLDDTDEIIWMSERDGWNHLLLINATTGEVKNRITSGEWAIREVERLDRENRELWLKVGGIVPGEDPYHVHLIRVQLDGTSLTRLTDGDGTHSWQFSPDENWIIDTYSRVDLPPVTTLRNTESGELVCELERADWSALLATGWQAPERFVTKGRDGTTDIYGIIVRPMNWDPTLKYPVLEDIYAGPQAAFTPKAFGRLNGMYAMAELGFIVVKLDGMGTSQRSKAFHDVCWKNLGDSGFPDRIAWITAAAKDRPEMDIDRVGIWGGSAGGQSALRALLAFGEFYDAAAADCGCHDNRMDKIWWNEQWMGYPIGLHYEDQSNVTQAHRLQGKLLLTVGELDTNVDPASTIQVANALIAADKDFELIVFPGGGHGSGSGPYGTRRMMEFFMRSLGNPTLR